MNVSQPDASNEALHALCADLVYRNNLQLAPQDFVTGGDNWPQIKTVVHKYTISHRNDEATVSVPGEGALCVSESPAMRPVTND